MAAPVLAYVGQLLCAQDMGLIRWFRWHAEGDDVITEIIPVPALKHVEIAPGSRLHGLITPIEPQDGSQSGEPPA